MAILVHNVSAEWNQQLYDQVAKKVFGGTLTPKVMPAGLVSHVACAHPTGGLQVVDIWESEAHWQKFLQETLIPAAQEMHAPPFDTKIYPVHNHVR